MTLTEKAMYIDRVMKEETHDPAIVYKYLKDIIFVLSIKKRLFKNPEYYEDFSWDAAGSVYMRLIRPIEEGSRLKPIKSVLNYIKLILYGMSDKYAQQYFSQVIDTNRMANGEAAKAALNELIIYPALKSNRENSAIMLKNYVDSFPKILKEAIKNNKYNTSKTIHENLYLSILLSFINNLTFIKLDDQRLQTTWNKDPNVNNTRYNTLKTQLINKLLKQEAIKYNLDEEVSNYINLLFINTKEKVAKELRSYIDDERLSDDIMESLLLGFEGEADNGED